VQHLARGGFLGNNPRLIAFLEEFHECLSSIRFRCVRSDLDRELGFLGRHPGSADGLRYGFRLFFPSFKVLLKDVSEGLFVLFGNLWVDRNRGSLVWGWNRNGFNDLCLFMLDLRFAPPPLEHPGQSPEKDQGSAGDEEPVSSG